MAALKPILILASGLIMIVAFIFYAVSNGLPSWGTVDALGVTRAKSGLWRECVLGTGGFVCADNDCLSDGDNDAATCAKLRAARAFVTLACIFSILSALCLLARLVEKIDSNRSMVVLSIGLPVITLIMGIIGVPIGIALIVKDSDFQIAAGSILAIVALVVNLIGAGLALAVPRQ